MRLLAILLVSSSLVLAAADVPVPTFTLPAGWKSVTKANVTTVLPSQGAPHIQLWSIPGATSVADVVAKAPALIVNQVKDFVVSKTAAITVAGAAATQLTGTGTEADDGDPANAEVTVFALSGTIWVLVAHGEGEGTAERHADLLAVLGSITAP